MSDPFVVISIYATAAVAAGLIVAWYVLLGVTATLWISLAFAIRSVRSLVHYYRFEPFAPLPTHPKAEAK